MPFRHQPRTDAVRPDLFFFHAAGLMPAAAIAFAFRECFLLRLIAVISMLFSADIFAIALFTAFHVYFQETEAGFQAYLRFSPPGFHYAVFITRQEDAASCRRIFLRPAFLMRSFRFSPPEALP